ncbi:MAG: hypothetical protein GXY33_04615 [Phycisphaerae bacterium]|nr:hypothetical protein [Phycisphaerae bacterium]
MVREKNDDKRAMLLGMGLDNEDGHVRITKGTNFRLLGGSHETHERMQEQAIKFNEKLDRRGRRLEEVSREEFVDLAREVGMPVLPDDLPRPRE